MINKKKTSRQVQAENTKNKIYQASLELLDKKGYENLKIKDICKHAGVSIGSFYNYYESKSDILSEIFEKADNYFEEVVSEQLNKDTCVDNVILFFEYYAKYIELVGVETMTQLYRFNNSLFIKKGRYMQNLLIDILEKGQENQETINNQSPEEICDYLFIAARGVSYDWCIHNGKYSLVGKMKNYITQLTYIFIKKAYAEL